jgi:hypothetical protein
MRVYKEKKVVFSGEELYKESTDREKGKEDHPDCQKFIG